MFSPKMLVKKSLVTAALVAFASLPAIAAEIVTGPVDKAGFQAIVDAADEGDQIVCLGGIYDFSDPGGVVLDKGLRIRAADESDPPLFVGDTVDGTVNGPPVSPSPARTGNTAFILANDAKIHGLRIEGLHFTGFNIALALYLGVDFDAPGCPFIPAADFTDLVIARNNIRQNGRGIQIFGGPLRGFSIRDNVIDSSAGTPSFGILVLGSISGCASGPPLNLVRPEDGEVKNNSITARFGVFSFGVVNNQIKSNSVDSSLVGIYVGDDTAAVFADDGPIAIGSVKNNVITGGPFGIAAEGPTTIEGAEIKGNTISVSLIDVLLDFGANGFTVKTNTFSGASAVAEVVLEADTHDNRVIVGAGDTVIDLGTDNEVIVE